MPSLREFAGTLTQQMTLESPGETAGDATLTWTVVETFWGSLQGITGTEGGLIAEADYRIRRHWTSGVSPRMRIGLSGRKFSVVSVLDPDALQRELIIFAKELV